MVANLVYHYFVEQNLFIAMNVFDVILKINIHRTLIYIMIVKYVSINSFHGNINLKYDSKHVYGHKQVSVVHNTGRILS